MKENHKYMHGLDLYITILLVMNVVYNNKLSTCIATCFFKHSHQPFLGGRMKFHKGGVFCWKKYLTLKNMFSPNHLSNFFHKIRRKKSIGKLITLNKHSDINCTSQQYVFWKKKGNVFVFIYI
jgi:hypothetical protein